MGKWEQKNEILDNLDEFLNLDDLKDEDNLLVIALFRLLDMLYEDEGESGIEYVQEIWQQICSLN